MACSVISDKINIVVDATTSLPATSTPATSGSALQNPDMSRVQLGALLRRTVRVSGNSVRRTFWSSFKTFQIDSHANTNT